VGGGGERASEREGERESEREGEREVSSSLREFEHLGGSGKQSRTLPHILCVTIHYSRYTLLAVAM